MWEILIHEDFSENFHCKQATEIQSAYYATIGVTLFTVMIYYQKDGDLKHKCCVVVSDSLDHSKDAVFAFNKRVLDYTREIIGEVNHVHYISDGAVHLNSKIDSRSRISRGSKLTMERPQIGHTLKLHMARELSMVLGGL